MDESQALEQVARQTKDHAKRLAEDVVRGVSTPRLAARLLMEYGRGVIDAVTLIYDSPRAMDAIGHVLDKEMTKMDPDWRNHHSDSGAGTLPTL